MNKEEQLKILVARIQAQPGAYSDLSDQRFRFKRSSSVAIPPTFPMRPFFAFSLSFR